MTPDPVEIVAHATTRCLTCQHGPGYHDGEDGAPAVTRPAPINPPLGRCHHDGCDCTAWLPPITEPDVYPDIPNDAYHRDPVAGGSLSSSGARALLAPSCPAKFDWIRHNGQNHRTHWDIGHAAHKLVLGTGPELVVIEEKDWRKKAAQEARDAAHAEGKVPLLVADHQKVTAMADAIRAHPIASMLFDPARGRPEQTLIWRDGPTGVWCRARLDWLPTPLPGERLICPDYKTAWSAHPDGFSRAVAQHGYQVQDWWYQAGCRALGLADADTAFVFVVQEKDPPYLVTIVELDHVAHRIGGIQARQAIDIYADCRRTGQWPGFSEEIVHLSLPRWAEREWEDML